MAIERGSEGDGGGGAAEGGGGDTVVITLQHGEHGDSTLYRLEQGWRLQFRPGASLLGRKLFLYTNHVAADTPGEEPARFERSQYRAAEWRRAGDGGGGAGGDGAGLLVGDEDVCCELVLARAGAFHYYFVYDTAEAALGPQGSGWWQVAPVLRAGRPLARVPLDAVMCQTVLAKCLGALPRWEPALRVAREAGYNMLHFTPVQRLGASGSSYSIADQLQLDPRLCAAAGEAGFQALGALVARMQDEWGVVSICDVVLNHTANESPWLAEHPEAAYNCVSSAHLRPAALLDAALARLAADAAAGALEARGVPRRVHTEQHVQAVRRELEARVAELRLHEMFQCDAEQLERQFRAAAADRVPAAEGAGAGGALRLVPDPARRRLRATVDMELALQLYNVRAGGAEGESDAQRAARAGGQLRQALEALNAAAAAETAAHLRAAVDNCEAGMRYFRLQEDGPKIEEVSLKNPLVPRYFTFPVEVGACTAAEAEACVYGERGVRVAAHNGWVMDADPLQDFAAREHGGRVYLRRELIAWGDSVKLRYGASPSESPFLWAHMRAYVERTASLFHGLRLDNCHSTPLHVAEHLLDCARRVRPDLYVVAELFTNSDQVDNIFVNRLGITSLIREALSAWDAHEQGRLVHRFGGRAVGAFLPPPPPAPRLAQPAVAHALLLDLTHDNPSPIAKRSVFDMLPSAALVAMACCATGSTRGYDELVPHHVHVVDEERLYCEWGEGAASEGRVGPNAGMLAARRKLNELHAALAKGGYSEVFVDQMDGDVVAVTRHEPRSRQSVVLVAVTAFRAPDEAAVWRAPRALRFEGELQEVVLEATLRHRQHRSGGSALRAPGAHAGHARFITGLAEYECEVRERVPLASSEVFAGARQEGALTVLEFRPLAPGTVVAVRVAPRAPAAAALRELHALLAPGGDPLGLGPALRPLDLADLNAVLYRCDAEERDASGGAAGAYEVPGHGALVYAGLQGAASLLRPVRAADDLGHPLCANLRAGDWLAEYTCARLEREPRLRALGARCRAALAPLRDLPRFLQPAYFEALHGAVHAAAERAALALMAPWCGEGALARGLALASVQLCGRVPSASLPGVGGGAGAATLSAGLPHFATGYMRCWGRDTFISLRGLLLLPGRAADARAHILGFAACLRHGLIPNLLDGGKHARFNCRDAVWWWLQSIQQYCTEVPGGHALLAEPVERLFPRDDSAPGEAAPAQPLRDVMQEALEAHFQGRAFRERGAGPALDAHMAERGFLVQVGVQPDTGFPFGGSDANCGTWMDKMGSSERAGTRGRPATPRDGSAVELVALAYSAVAWLAEEHRARRYPHAGVTRPAPGGGATSWEWQTWADTIRRSFERHFWVPEAPSAADARPDLVHRRAIYKDSHGASQPWADYQLRCNFPVAMCVAPALFDPRHAALALDTLERHLLAPLGLRTLDPGDWAYRPDYRPDDDSADPALAHGFNYHQGPEWVWPLGFYLRARLLFAPAGRRARAAPAVLRALGPLAVELEASPWRGLPELCDAGGRFCAASCRTQAWSAATALEVLHALRAQPSTD